MNRGEEAAGGAVEGESSNLLNAWLATVPGNSAHNLRRRGAARDESGGFESPVHARHRFPRSRHFGREALAVFETRHRTPYFFNLHVDDVGHTLVLGATGSGKSFLLNFLITQGQRYSPHTVVFDLGHSYRKLATLFRGSYLEVGLRGQGVSINPFALPPTPENLHFLHAFVRVLLEGGDSYRMSDAEDRELYEALENLYVLDPFQRRLFTLSNILPRSLSSAAQQMGRGRPLGDVFDHVEDTLTLQSFQVFEFENAKSVSGGAGAPPLLCAASRQRAPDRLGGRSATDALRDGRGVALHSASTLRAYVQEALKTWRKRNAAMVLATQSIDDFASADLLRTVVESCPTKLLLANPALDRARYADLSG